MKTKSTFIAIIISLFIFTNSVASTYTWTGSKDTVFTDSNNWSSSNGITFPGVNDTAIIVSATNRPVLAGDYDIYRLVMTSGDFDLKSYVFTATGSGSFSGGTLSNGTLVVRGTSCIFTGATLNVVLDINCDDMRLSGGTFNGTSQFASAGQSTCVGNGGCVFNAAVSIIHTGNRGTDFRMGTVAGDEFNADVSFTNSSDGKLFITETDTTYFNGNVELNNNGTQLIYFGRYGGVSELASGKTISVGSTGYAANELILYRFKQFGATSQNLALTGTALLTMKGCEFNGSIIVTAPEILYSYTTFNGTTDIIKTGSGTNYWYGNNSFNGETTIANSGAGSLTEVLRLADVLPNVYNGDVSFECNGKSIQVVTNTSNEFFGNISINSTGVNFGKGEVIMKGEANQEVNGSVSYIFDNLTLDKTDGTVQLNTPASLYGTLKFTSGILITDSVNLINFEPNSEAQNASNQSFVSGPVMKVGDTEFEFPVGKGSFFRPILISATLNATNAYRAEYFNQPQLHGTKRDTTLEYINFCNFWNLSRITGMEKVAATIGWETDHCGLYDSSLVTVALWDDMWKNLELALFEGTSSSGKLTSNDSIDASYSDIVFAYTPAAASLTLVPLTADIPSTFDRTIDRYYGLNGTNVIQPGASWDVMAMSEQVSVMQPSTMRYPGGIVGNWWDWRAGWFVDSDVPFQNCVGFPTNYENLLLQDNHLETFAEALGIIGSQPLFMLNLLTSNLPYQLAMLHESEILGMPVRQVELGNEFYRDSDCEYIEIFPLVSDYATVTDEWIDAVHERFNQSSVAILAADPRNFGPTTRQGSWNDGLDVVNRSQNLGAVTIHPYYGAGIGLGNGECIVVDYNVNGNQSPARMFLHTFDNINSLVAGEFGKFDQKPVWMSEYNLWDGSRGIIHGSWAHGIKTALHTMAMLEQEQISNVNCHTMVGNGTFASYFNSEDAFNYSNFCSPTFVQPSIPTGQYSMSSLGYAMHEIGSAMRFATEARQLVFAPVPPATQVIEINYGAASHEAVYGWHFKDDDDNQHMIIINMSDEEVSIDLSGAVNLEEPQWMKLISMQGSGALSSNVMNSFITNVTSTDIEYVLLVPTIPNPTLLSGSFVDPGYIPYVNASTIAPYSIMRFAYFSNGVYSSTIYSSEDEVCENRNFYLYANASPGATQYEWYDDNGMIGTTITPVFLAIADGNGPYYVDVTFGTSGTFQSANSINVNIKTIETLTITPPTSELCASSITPLTLTASLTGSGTNLYCWIGIDDAEIHSNLTSQLTDVIEVLPDQTSTYIVYATDGQCSVREEITIDVIGTVDFGNNPKTFCSGTGPFTLETGLDDQIWSFEWSNSSTDPTLVVNPTVPVTYAVTVTNGAGCTVSASVEVLPVECCSPTADISFLLDDVNGPIITSALLIDAFTNLCGSCVNGNVITSSAIVYVEGELFVDENLDIYNVAFLFADRGSLTIDNYRRLGLYNCDLDACSGNMWIGINVLSRGILNTFQNTSINNAYIGVSAQPKTKLSINNTDFNNNFTGIESHGAPISVIADFNKAINQGRFQTTSNLLDPYTNSTLLATNATDRGYAGIVAENDMISLFSNSTGNFSQFEKFSNGIFATNSILNISNTWFNDMQPETEYNWLGEQGVGVFNFGTFSGTGSASLNLTGLGTEPGNPATFASCESGITTEVSALTLKDAKLVSVFNGVTVTTPLFQPVSIIDNIIEATNTGIGLFSTDLCGYIDIRENKIDIDATSQPSYGIGMFNSLVPFNWSVCRINCNDITLDNAQNGIVISGFSSSLASRTLGVNDNIIQINDNSSTSNGILFEDVTGAFLQHNAVTGSDPTDATTTNAYKLFNSPSIVISQNSSDGTKVGFQFEMGCNSMDNIRGNSIGDHFHGMELQASSFTGTQEYTGNVWSGYVGNPPYIYEDDPLNPGNSIGAWADPSMDPLDLIQSQFTVNSSSTLVHFPYFTPIGTDWFFPGSGSNQTFSYSDNCLILPLLDPELRLGYSDSLIVNDTITSPVYQEELRINARLHLRDKLVLMLQSEDIPSFFASHLSGYSSTTPGKIACYRDTLSLISNIGADSIDFMVINDSILHSRLSEISLLQDGDSNESDTLFEQAKSIVNSLSFVRKNAVEQLVNNIESMVYNLMYGVTTSHAIESNLRDTYLGFYNLMMGEDTSEIKSVLNPIANQCIFEGGPGVTIARNLLAAMDSSVIYDDNMFCGSSRIGQVLIPILNKNYKKVTVYPNPSTGVFTVVIPKDQEVQKRVFSVYNLSGSHLYSLESNGDSGNIVLNLSGFAPGMYYLCVQADQTNYYQKLSIVR